MIIGKDKVFHYSRMQPDKYQPIVDRIYINSIGGTQHDDSRTGNGATHFYYYA